MEDQQLTIGKETLRLCTLHQLELGKKSATALARDGRELTGALAGLGTVAVDFGGTTASVDLSRATKILVEDPADAKDAADGVPYTVVVRQKNEVVVKLPASIDQVASGANGRYLILHLQRLGKLAVLDVTIGIISHYLPAPAADILYAAGADKLVVISPEQSMIERWSLATFERIGIVPLELIGKTNRYPSSPS